MREMTGSGTGLPGLSVPPSGSFLPDPAPAWSAEAAPSRRRLSLQDIQPTFRCSVVGTCLTTAELRRFFVRMGDADARTASDHHLHTRGVRLAGLRDEAGRQLGKTIDRRHEGAIRRFAAAQTSEAVRDLWSAALDGGDIPGAYWAVMTHPASGKTLVEDAFAEIHMMSHLVGSASRLDLARLRRQEQRIGELESEVDALSHRLAEAGRETASLRERLARSDGQIGLLRASLAARPLPQATPPAAGEAVGTLRHRLAVVERKLASAEATIDEQARDLARAAIQEADLRSELAAAVGAAADIGGECAVADAPFLDLSGRTFVYVGGRPQLHDQLRRFVAEHGGTLLTHDGGIEENVGLLPGLVARADAAYIPVDCVSHMAATRLKKLCRDAGKTFVPLRSASFAGFATALRRSGLFVPLTIADQTSGDACCPSQI